jgi:hypothetical protein
MYPIVDAATRDAVDADWYREDNLGLKCDYFGFIGKIDHFSANDFTIPAKNAYFLEAVSIPLSLCYEENSVVSEYRDSERFLVDGEKQTIVDIPPYDRADYIIEIDGKDQLYFQIKWDGKPAAEVGRINAGLIKACNFWRDNIDKFEFGEINVLGYDWDFELTEDGIKFIGSDGEMLFDLDGNFIKVNYYERD